MKKISLIGFFIIAFAINGLCNNNLPETIRFATIQQAKELLATDDAFTKSWSRFDIDSRIHMQNGTKDSLMKYIAAQVRKWTEQEKEILSSTFDGIQKQIANQDFKITFPDEIYIVKTTGDEEGGADAYTRGNYIVLKGDVVAKPTNELKELLVHELFHILTRNDPEFRKTMYAIIGFELMNPVPYPESIKDFRITNPDAPQTDSFIKLKTQGNDVECMMILYAKTDYTNGDFFKYLNTGFLKLTGDTIKGPALVDNNPVIYSMKDVSNFFEQVGMNTQHIIHPEEILADNFAFAILNRTRLPDQKIVSEIQKILR